MSDPAAPVPLPSEVWDELVERAARLGFILSVAERDDGRWAAYFERVDDERVQSFAAHDSHKLLAQVSLTLEIARRAARGAARYVQDRW